MARKVDGILQRTQIMQTPHAVYSFTERNVKFLLGNKPLFYWTVYKKYRVHQTCLPIFCFFNIFTIFSNYSMCVLG